MAASSSASSKNHMTFIMIIGLIALAALVVGVFALVNADDNSGSSGTTIVSAKVASKQIFYVSSATAASRTVKYLNWTGYNFTNKSTNSSMITAAASPADNGEYLKLGALKARNSHDFINMKIQATLLAVGSDEGQYYVELHTGDSKVIHSRAMTEWYDQHALGSASWTTETVSGAKAVKHLMEVPMRIATPTTDTDIYLKIRYLNDNGELVVPVHAVTNFTISMEYGDF